MFSIMMHACNLINPVPPQRSPRISAVLAMPSSSTPPSSCPFRCPMPPCATALSPPPSNRSSHAPTALSHLRCAANPLLFQPSSCPVRCPLHRPLPQPSSTALSAAPIASHRCPSLPSLPAISMHPPGAAVSVTHVVMHFRLSVPSSLLCHPPPPSPSLPLNPAPASPLLCTSLPLTLHPITPALLLTRFSTHAHSCCSGPSCTGPRSPPPAAGPSTRGSVGSHVSQLHSLWGIPTAAVG